VLRTIELCLHAVRFLLVAAIKASFSLSNNSHPPIPARRKRGQLTPAIKIIKDIYLTRGGELTSIAALYAPFALGVLWNDPETCGILGTPI
jgi:hypothetical protein